MSLVYHKRVQKRHFPIRNSAFGSFVRCMFSVHHKRAPISYSVFDPGVVRNVFGVFLWTTGECRRERSHQLFILCCFVFLVHHKRPHKRQLPWVILPLVHSWACMYFMHHKMVEKRQLQTWIHLGLHVLSCIEGWLKRSKFDQEFSLWSTHGAENPLFPTVVSFHHEFSI